MFDDKGGPEGSDVYFLGILNGGDSLVFSLALTVEMVFWESLIYAP